MFLKLLGAWLALLSASLCAQSTPDRKAVDGSIDRAKHLIVSSVDRRLPKVSLEFFLEYEAEGAPVSWEKTDCGADAKSRGGNDLPVCVEADFDLHHRTVAVTVSLGEVTKESAGPTAFDVTISEPDGATHTVRRLGDLPMELHRPPPKFPAELPTRVSSLRPSAPTASSG